MSWCSDTVMWAGIALTFFVVCAHVSSCRAPAKGYFGERCTQMQGSGSCPQGHGAHNSVLACWWLDRHPHSERTRQNHTNHNHHNHMRNSSCRHECYGAVAVKRRRKRRLRAMLRHERQTVAMELTTALHHRRGAQHNTERDDGQAQGIGQESSGP